MNKPAKNNRQAELKSHGNRSHNSDSQLIALIRSLARRAAKADFEAMNKCSKNHNMEGEE